MEYQERVNLFISELRRELERYGLSSFRTEIREDSDTGDARVEVYHAGPDGGRWLCEFYRLSWPSREVAHFLRGLLGERHPGAGETGADAYPDAFIGSVHTHLGALAGELVTEVVGGRVYVTVDGLSDVFGLGDSVHAPYFLRRGLEARGRIGI